MYILRNQIKKDHVGYSKVDNEKDKNAIKAKKHCLYLIYEEKSGRINITFIAVIGVAT